MQCTHPFLYFFYSPNDPPLNLSSFHLNSLAIDTILHIQLIVCFQHTKQGMFFHYLFFSYLVVHKLKKCKCYTFPRIIFFFRKAKTRFILLFLKLAFTSLVLDFFSFQSKVKQTYLPFFLTTADLVMQYNYPFLYFFHSPVDQPSICLLSI